MAHDVFISHSSKDKAAAAVCAVLEQAGVRCWIAPRDIIAGSDWGDSVIAAIAASRVMVLILSANAQASPQVRNEVTQAVASRVRIATLRIDGPEPSGALKLHLSSSHWLDALTPPFERHLNVFCRDVKALLGKAAAADPPVARPVRADPRSARRRRRAAWVGLLLVAAAGVGAWAVLRGGWGPGLNGGTVGGPSGSQPAGSTSLPGPTPGPTPITALLATARANDGTDVAQVKAALAALDEALGLDPTNADARALRRKVAAYRRTYTNTLNIRLVEVQPGEFLMGSTSGEPGRYDNETQHLVKLTKPFMLGAFEVTRGQFAAFVKDSGYETDAEKEGFAYVWNGGAFEKKNGASFRDVGFVQTDEHPVVNVSWNDAKAFCDWLGKKEKRRYRLPTEAEWEYAARAGTKGAYIWGDDPDDGKGWANATDQSAAKQIPGLTAFRWDDGFVVTAPVGQFKANGWGLYDITGNALEWCGDWYEVHGAGHAVDPTGPANPQDSAKTWRVLRGGSWYNPFPSHCRVAYRTFATPDSRNYFIGFRLCLDFE